MEIWGCLDHRPGDYGKNRSNGVAWAVLTLGQKTTDSPYYIESTPNWILAGMNLVSVSAITGSGTIYTDKPFEAYGLPGLRSA